MTAGGNERCGTRRQPMRHQCHC
uniref:Uncharacterized protein n=1 Tax=Arundo donax TaxID=35708 RepID=A0A0A9CAB8_ARUDO